MNVNFGQGAIDANSAMAAREMILQPGEGRQPKPGWEQPTHHPEYEGLDSLPRMDLHGHTVQRARRGASRMPRFTLGGNDGPLTRMAFT